MSSQIAPEPKNSAPAVKTKMPPLLRYAMEQNLDKLRCLFADGQNTIDINEKDHRDKYTALMWASKNGHALAVEFLISKKADLDITGGWVSTSPAFFYTPPDYCCT